MPNIWQKHVKALFNLPKKPTFRLISCMYPKIRVTSKNSKTIIPKFITSFELDMVTACSRRLGEGPAVSVKLGWRSKEYVRCISQSRGRSPSGKFLEALF